MFSKKPKIYLIFLMTIVFLWSSFSYASASNQKKVVLILINQLSFLDQSYYSSSPIFKELELKGSFGAMNINSASSRTAENSYLTMGAGSRAVGIRDLGDSFMINEQIELGGQKKIVGDIFKQQTGITQTGNNKIVFLPLPQLRQVEQKFPFQLGALGEALKKEKLQSRVYGNNDTYSKVRLAPLISMDGNGISYGDVGDSTLLVDSSRPFGIKTNYEYLLQKWNQSLKENISLTIYDLGDLYRLEQFKGQMNDSHEAQIRSKVFEEIGEFIKRIYLTLDEDQLLIVASPMVSKASAKENNLLAPIWMYQKNNDGDNLLTSATTRRDGIVANVDLPPTILEWLDINDYPQTILGQPINIANTDLNLSEELNHIWSINKMRSQVLYPYVSWQIFILVSSMLVWLRNNKDLNILKRILQIALIGILFVPILLLISATYTPKSSVAYVVLLITSSLILSWLINRSKATVIFFAIGLLTFLALSLDLFIGAYLIKRSFLGYDPIIGARYYGIGNEYMGIYIGATLLFTTSLIQLWKNKLTLALVPIIYSLLSFILLSPSLGTNAGGAIAAFIGTGFAFLHIVGFRWTKKWIILLLFIFILGFIALVLVNFFTPTESQSHIGRALNQLFEGNVLFVLQTIQRKLAMNWRLIQVSYWSKVMITSIFAIGLLLFKPKNIFKKWFEQYKSLFHGFYGIIAGSIVSLIVNDSGVIAAATMIIYVAIPLLYFGLDETQKRWPK